MAILKHLTLKQHNTTKSHSECLPGASGPQAITMPNGSITATISSVAKVLEKQQKRAKPKNHVVNVKYIWQKERSNIWYQFNDYIRLLPLSCIFDLKVKSH